MRGPNPDFSVFGRPTAGPGPARRPTVLRSDRGPIRTPEIRSIAGGRIGPPVPRPRKPGFTTPNHRGRPGSSGTEPPRPESVKSVPSVVKDRPRPSGRGTGTARAGTKRIGSIIDSGTRPGGGDRAGIRPAPIAVARGRPGSDSPPPRREAIGFQGRYSRPVPRTSSMRKR